MFTIFFVNLVQENATPDVSSLSDHVSVVWTTAQPDAQATHAQGETINFFGFSTENHKTWNIIKKIQIQINYSLCSSSNQITKCDVVSELENLWPRVIQRKIMRTTAGRAFSSAQHLPKSKSFYFTRTNNGPRHDTQSRWVVSISRLTNQSISEHGQLDPRHDVREEHDIGVAQFGKTFPQRKYTSYNSFNGQFRAPFVRVQNIAVIFNFGKETD